MPAKIMKKINVPWSDTDFRVIIGTTRIDYDHEKEYINREKHGYSLESAVHFLKKLVFPFGGSSAGPLITHEPKIIKEEVRHNHLAKDKDGNVVFFVTTMRPDEVVRIISFRRASKKEATIYYAVLTDLMRP